LAFTFLFASLFLARYTVAGYEYQLTLRDAASGGTQGVGV